MTQAISVKPLNYYATLSPEADLKADLSEERKNTFYAVAASASFIALSLFGNLLTFLTFPEYFPLTAAICFTIMPNVMPFAKNHLKIASDYETAAKVDQLMIQRLKELGNKSSLEINQELQKAKLDPARIQTVTGLKNLTVLNPLLARYQTWEEQPRLLDAEAAKLAKQATEKPKFTKEIRLDALNLMHRKKREAKLMAAFCYGLLKNPTNQATPSDIFEIHSPSFEDRMIALQFDKEQGDAFIRFKDKKFGTLPASTFDALPIPEIANRLFQAAPAA